MLGDTQLEKGFGIGGGAFMQCMSPAQFAGGAGVNISKGQQVWLCWDLEPAADVLLCSGCFLLERGGGGGISVKPFGLLCRYPQRAASISGGDGSVSQY